MSSFKDFFKVAFALLVMGCATAVPIDLTNARQAYRQASTGPALTKAPAELQEAHVALLRAESAYIKEPQSFQVRDLSYIALRKSQIAVARATNDKEQVATEPRDHADTPNP